MTNTNLAPVLISGVSCYEKDGTAYLKLEDVARGLGFTTVAASGNEVIRWGTVHKYLTELGVATSCNGSDYRSKCPEYIMWFRVSSRNNIPRKRFDEAIEYIQRWKPSTNTVMLIQQTNGQTSLFDRTCVPTGRPIDTEAITR